MTFSELSLLDKDTGLEYTADKLTLSGSLSGYAVFISDAGAQYVVTVFAGIPPVAEPQIRALCADMPLVSLESKTEYFRICFRSAGLFQEKAVLLVDFVAKLSKFLAAKGFEKTKPDERLAEIREKTAPTKRPREKTSFDRRSVFGIICALVGAAACAIIQGIVVRVQSDSVGFEISTWIAGAATALIILCDYRFTAKKFDIAGIISCTLLTAAAILSGVMFASARSICLTAAENGASVGFIAVLADFWRYAAEYPDVSAGAVELLLKDAFTAVVGSAFFYGAYFRKNADQMYEK